MRTNKDFRNATSYPDDLQRGTKLSPIKKSGKERHALYSDYEDDEEESFPASKRESALDYYDDEND